jgi:hypothetical protein
MGPTALATASRAGEPARQMVPAIWAAGEVGRGPREPVELGDDERLRLAAPSHSRAGMPSPSAPCSAVETRQWASAAMGRAAPTAPALFVAAGLP